MNSRFKIIIGGPAGSGKSSLSNRLIYDKYIQDTHPTIGVDFDIVRFQKGENDIKLSVWDFGGEERFRFLLPTYVRGSKGALIVFDLKGNYDYLDVIREWLEPLKELLEANIPIILVGNKEDLLEENDKEEERLQVHKFAESNELFYIETSAKTGYNVDECFQELINRMLKNIQPELNEAIKYQPLYRISRATPINLHPSDFVENTYPVNDYLSFFDSNKEQVVSLVNKGQFDLAYKLIASTRANFRKKGMSSIVERINEFEKKIDIKKFEIITANKKKMHSLFLKEKLRCTLHRDGKCQELEDIRKNIKIPEISGFFMYEFPKEDSNRYKYQEYKEEIEKIIELLDEVNRTTVFNIQIPREAILGDKVKTCDFCRISRSYDFGILLLSPPNPNAYLEAGLFLSLGKKVFLFNNDSILKETPFDLTPFFFIHYKNLEELEENWNKKFLPILEEFETIYLKINKKRRLLRNLTKNLAS